MKNFLRLVKVTLILVCLSYSFNIGGVRQNLVFADEEGGAACVTRSGGTVNICDCVGTNCGKVCSASISNYCASFTCRTKNTNSDEIDGDGGSF